MNYNFYSEFSPDEVNILTELDNFLKNSLKYCDRDPVLANNLAYDIDDKCVYALPINKSKRFESAKDGRPWSNIRESKRSNFSGDQYISTCRGSNLGI